MPSRTVSIIPKFITTNNSLQQDMFCSSILPFVLNVVNSSFSHDNGHCSTTKILLDTIPNFNISFSPMDPYQNILR